MRVFLWWFALNLLSTLDTIEPHLKAPYWGRTDFNSIREDQANVNWKQMLSHETTSGKCESFKRQLGKVSDQHVPMRMKGKDDKILKMVDDKEYDGLIRKKGKHIR